MTTEIQGTPTTPARAEESFVTELAAKFEAQDAAADTAASKDTPAPPATPAPRAATPDQEDDALDGAAPAPDAADDDEDAPTDPSDQGTTPAEADDEDEEPQHTDAGEGAESEDELDGEFTAAAEKHKLPTTLEDLPEEARPLVAKRLKELEAGFTRAMQDARSYRQEEVQLRAEERFRAEHPELVIVELLNAHPELGEKVNEILDGLAASPTQREAHEIVVAKKRGDVRDALIEERTAYDTRAERGAQLEQYAIRAAKRAGVPVELGVEEAVVAHIVQHGDVDEATIDRIVKEKATTYQRYVRANRRAASQQYVKDKVESTGAGLKVKPGTGSAPAPGGKVKPRNDDEFVESFAARM